MAVVVVDRRFGNFVAEAAQNQGFAVGDSVDRLAARLVVGHSMRKKIDYAGLGQRRDAVSDLFFPWRDEAADQDRAAGREIYEMADCVFRLLGRATAMNDYWNELRIVKQREVADCRPLPVPWKARMAGVSHFPEQRPVFVAQLFPPRVVFCVMAKCMEHVGVKRDKVEEPLAPYRKGGVAHELAYRLAGSALEVADIVAEWLG